MGKFPSLPQERTPFVSLQRPSWMVCTTSGFLLIYIPDRSNVLLILPRGLLIMRCSLIVISRPVFQSYVITTIYSLSFSPFLCPTHHQFVLHIRRFPALLSETLTLRDFLVYKKPRRKLALFIRYCFLKSVWRHVLSF
ncbi:hypothetical protein RRG08_037641 [Elysia crispata]|uniref:Uncharacterized protein n=1 Tax=Elysia crispata TaxID=231223 RepID=A0AAE0YH55_9GAST|nr:hypothetical protein RRG08_037641 [Elysia crispata]